ncbi:FecR domain-containing protein [Maribellus sp. CM-23]|uniref:FecR family protein n=1 Tax=Maribellus sp. CM-23 TaxID=2781026 RepID=UPI001F2C7760|nr:FecR domain-containing protein [Maribellus sp. CM-23]MCE4563048.1 FecR domain-containing protein [Maribellus sp. CM-23]
MNNKSIHSEDSLNNQHSFLGKGKIAWEKSDAEVWAELEKKITAQPAGKTVQFRTQTTRWSVAAVFLVLVGLAGIAAFYSKTIETLPGEHLTALLPDGSKVELNAGSTLTYYPLRWKLQRKLDFEGEGFFNVQKGKKFLVQSSNGTTQVLGTSFNIYARDENYRVTCLTGKVDVSTLTGEHIVLLPNNHAELEEGKLVVKKMFNPESTIGWTNNQFFFAGRPLKEVIDEIERQYAVTIELDPQLNNRNFGSNFSKKPNVEEVLGLVCKPMNLKFVKQSENVYRIVDKS